MVWKSPYLYSIFALAFFWRDCWPFDTETSEEPACSALRFSIEPCDCAVAELFLAGEARGRVFFSDAIVARIIVRDAEMEAMESVSLV